MPYKSHQHRAQMKVLAAQGKIDPAIIRQLDEESRGLKLPTSHFRPNKSTTRKRNK